MKDYYQTFFEQNISAVFMCEVREPVSLELPTLQQVRMILEHTYINDVNLAMLKMLYGDEHTDKSVVINKKVTSMAEPQEYESEDSSGFQFYKKFIESNYDIKDLESNITPPVGESKWFLVSMKGIIEDGYLVGYWGSQRDITELKKLNEQLEIVNKELNEKVEEIENFTYLSSHNIQTPLHNLQNFSSLLMRKYGDKFDDLGNQSLRFINDSTNKASRILNRLVFYFGIDNNREFEQVDTQEMLREIIRQQTDWKSHINNIYFENLPTISGNRSNLAELFSILIENAIIHNKGKKDLKIQVESEELEHEIRFAIIDNGIGISPKNQSEIFRMYKSNLDYSRGMGLAIAKKIVNSHKGKIWLQSTLNQGTTFFFTISKSKK